MKKIITILLAVLLLAGMCVPAFAAENNGGQTSADVKGTYKAGKDSPDTISAEIVWEEMKFTYTESPKVWNPGTHQYDQPDGVWSEKQV